jgi:hypothetical protein
MGTKAWAGGGAGGIGAATVGGAWRTNGAAPGGSAVCPPGAGAAFGAALFGDGPVRGGGGGVPAPPAGGVVVEGAV